MLVPPEKRRSDYGCKELICYTHETDNSVARTYGLVALLWYMDEVRDSSVFGASFGAQDKTKQLS